MLDRAKINVKMERGSAVISIKLSSPSKEALAYLSALFLQNNVEIAASKSAKNSLMFEIKSKDIDKAMGLLKA